MGAPCASQVTALTPPPALPYRNGAVVGAAGNVLLLAVKAELIHPAGVEVEAAHL